MHANFKYRVLVACIAGVALAVLSRAGTSREQEPTPKTLDELSKFAAAELFGPGHAPIEEMRTIHREYTNPTPAALEWSCKLSAKDVVIGEPLTVEMTVKNPSDTVSFQFSPPARGIRVASMQVWVRQVGEKTFHTNDELWHSSRKLPSMGVPVHLGPGETRRWVSRVDHFAGEHTGGREPGRLAIGWVYWLGADTFKQPGKYEVVLRYVNLARGKRKAETDRFEPVGARVFGPYPVTVTARPDTDPRWVADLRKVWDWERPTGGDAIIQNPDEEVVPFAKLSSAQLKATGPIGDDVRLWLLAREWERGRHVKDSLQPYLEELDKIGTRLPAGHPNRMAVEFLSVAARLDRGDETEALREATTSTNPDVQLLLADWVKKRAKKP